MSTLIQMSNGYGASAAAVGPVVKSGSDPAIVPVESPAGNVQGRNLPEFAESVPYGPNNEQLPERLQEGLRRLVTQYALESEPTRRQEIRRIKQAHQFWRGLQYLWWSEWDQNWHLPFEQRTSILPPFTKMYKC